MIPGRATEKVGERAISGVLCLGVYYILRDLSRSLSPRHDGRLALAERAIDISVDYYPSRLN